MARLSTTQSASGSRSNASNAYAVQGPPSVLDKTQLCKFFAKKRCSRGKACSFAHGPAELLQVDLFKTQLCTDFMGGMCWRKDCKFAHGPRELRSHARATDMVPPVSAWPAWKHIASGETQPPPSVLAVDAVDPMRWRSHVQVLAEQQGGRSCNASFHSVNSSQFNSMDSWQARQSTAGNSACSTQESGDEEDLESRSSKLASTRAHLTIAGGFKVSVINTFITAEIPLDEDDAVGIAVRKTKSC